MSGTQTYQDGFVGLGSRKHQLVPATAVVGSKEGVDHESPDQGSAHVILMTELEETIAFNLGKKVEEIGKRHDIGPVVICQRGHQRLDVLEQQRLADIEGPACDRHRISFYGCIQPAEGRGGRGMQDGYRTSTRRGAAKECGVKCTEEWSCRRTGASMGFAGWGRRTTRIAWLRIEP